MADADGATKFADIEKVEEGLKNLQPWPVSINSGFLVYYVCIQMDFYNML